MALAQRMTARGHRIERRVRAAARRIGVAHRELPSRRRLRWRQPATLSFLQQWLSAAITPAHRLQPGLRILPMAPHRHHRLAPSVPTPVRGAAARSRTIGPTAARPSRLPARRTSIHAVACTASRGLWARERRECDNTARPSSV